MQQMTHQRGGTFLGLVLGLVLGLGLALGVAVYVTKVPVTFVNKVLNRSAEQDASEVQKNKDWDPNTPLYGKNPAKPTTPVSPSDNQAGASANAPEAPATAATPNAPASGDSPSADPLGDLTRARGMVAAPVAALDPFTYYVQVGAYRTDEDAQAQRVKLSLAGFETQVSKREQSGKPVFRVRMGPFQTRDEANKAKESLNANSVETVMVRVQR